MSDKQKTKRPTNADLFEQLSKLSTKQFKMFYAAFVHYWANYKFFISRQSFFTLWCEFNLLCHELDESFPDQYDDYELIKSFCVERPYYFIDIIDLQLVKTLFCKHLDDRIDILSAVVNKLSTEGIHAAYEYSNVALGLNENVDDLVDGTVKHSNFFI